MITELLLGVPQAVIGFKQMKQLSKVPMPEYSVSPELQAAYNRADAMANQGFSPAERANMFQAQAGSMASQTRAGLARTGGSMSAALQVIGGMNQNQFLLGYGDADAKRRLDNAKFAYKAAQDVDKVRMMNQELRISRDQQKRLSASNLANMGIQNLASGMSDLEGMGMQMIGGLSGLGGGSAKSNTGAQSFLGNSPSGTLGYSPMSHEQAMQSFYFK
jgi:hypothetical protein